MSTEALLDARGTTHGSFKDNAKNGQYLREFFRRSPHWQTMPLEHREALDMMACKLSRILSGQSTFRDHFVDIIGYCTLALAACDDEKHGQVAPSPRG